METRQVPVIPAFGAFVRNFFVLLEVVDRPVSDGMAVTVPADDPERLFRLRRVPADVLECHAKRHAAPPFRLKG